MSIKMRNQDKGSSLLLTYQDLKTKADLKFRYWEKREKTRNTLADLITIRTEAMMSAGRLVIVH